MVGFPTRATLTGRPASGKVVGRAAYNRSDIYQILVEVDKAWPSKDISEGPYGQDQTGPGRARPDWDTR